jgi:hypothetical protein
LRPTRAVLGTLVFSCSAAREEPHERRGKDRGAAREARRSAAAKRRCDTEVGQSIDTDTPRKFVYEKPSVASYDLAFSL